MRESFTKPGRKSSVILYGALIAGMTYAALAYADQQQGQGEECQTICPYGYGQAYTYCNQFFPPGYQVLDCFFDSRDTQGGTVSVLCNSFNYANFGCIIP